MNPESLHPPKGRTLLGRRVLLILGSIPLYGNELTNISIMQTLKENGADVLVITNEHWGNNAVNPYLDKLGIEHVPLIFFGKPDRRVKVPRFFTWARLQWTENRKFREIVRRFRPTHIHVTNLWDVFNFFPSILQTGATLVFNAGNPPNIDKWISRLLWRMLVIRNFDSIVGNSRFTTEHFYRLGTAPTKTYTIHNKPPRPICATQSIQESYSDGAVRFLFVGQVSEHKGVGEFVDSAISLLRESRNCLFRIVGGGSEDYVAQLKHRVQASGFFDRIQFCGYQDDTSPHYSWCSVHVAPSKFGEAFGNMVAEAKFAGRPSLVFPDGALPSLVEHGVDGWICESYSADSLKCGMIFFLDQLETLGEFGAAARGSIMKLGLDQFDDRWISLYAS